jgi:hypothetical protein
VLAAQVVLDTILVQQKLEVMVATAMCTYLEPHMKPLAVVAVAAMMPLQSLVDLVAAVAVMWVLVLPYLAKDTCLLFLQDTVMLVVWE